MQLSSHGKRSAQTVRDGSPKGRAAGSVHDSPFPKGHGQNPKPYEPEAMTTLRGFADGYEGRR